MPVRNTTVWTPPNGTGYVTPSAGSVITTLAGVTITTISSSSLTIEAQSYQPKYDTAWTAASKTSTQWQPQSVTTIGSENLVTNSGLFLTDNLGDFLVTTTTYDTPKNQTVWSLSGA